MPQVEAPLIDGRTYSDLVAEVEELIEAYTAGAVEPRVDRLTGVILDEEIEDGDQTFPAGTVVSGSLAERIAAARQGPVKVKGWQPGQSDAGSTLVRIFSRMAELVITRLNRLPDRDFLAFLDLIGVQLDPPQAARVPLTFLLAPGSPVDALVPAGTQAVATALEGETDPPQFETERDLVVTRSQLVAIYSRDPGNDRWGDQTAAATGQTADPFKPFGSDRDQPIAHRLYVSHPLFGLPEAKTILLQISSPVASFAWSSSVVWSFWDGQGWRSLPSTTGSVQLSPASGFTASAVNGLDGFWLCGQLKDPLTPGGLLPRIDSLSVLVTIDDTGTLTVPERSFANQVSLDLSKDVFPFGEKPKIGDTFYLANEEALSKPGAVVDLHITPTNPSDPNATPPPAASTNVMLTWEFWDGRTWQILGISGPGAANADLAGNSTYQFIDTTNGFLAAPGGAGIVHFVVPTALAMSEVNGEMRHWLRVRIAKGNYGVEAKYTPQLTPATFQPPSLRSVLLGYRYASGSQAPQRVVTENDFLFADVTGAPFLPFVPSADVRPTLYLGFNRPGDTTGFANRATALFFQGSESMYDPAAERATVTDQAIVVWEYWNGELWDRLGTRDETNGLTQSGLLIFIGPPDFKASTELGRTAFWLRGRWDRGEYAIEPQLVRILSNTMWAAHVQTIQGEVLGSSRGEPGQIFNTLRTPVLDPPVLEVIEPDIPPGADLTALEAEEGEDAVTVVRDSAGQPLEVRVRWHEVPDLYASGPRSRHYVFDPLSGEVRFGDGIRGLVPPPGSDNVRMVRYRTGGGLAGNRPAGSIVRLKGTLPYISGVVQPVPADGGADEETLDAARARGPKRLRHRGRAVAAADFEDLAFEASPDVARAYAVPAQSASDKGQVGLIVVPAGDAAKPVPGLELLARVSSAVEAQVSPVVDVWVVGPDWLQVDVLTEVVPRQLEAATDVQTAVLERLRAFLHPLSGGSEGEGWELGRGPHRSDFYALIEDTPGVDHVHRLEIVETPREGGARPGRFLVFSGNHDVTVRGNDDGDAASSGSLS